jgi:hypothetical protein
VNQEEKVKAIFQHFSAIFGTAVVQERILEFSTLQLLVDLSGIDRCFSEDEVWLTISSMLADKATGSDGFSCQFYHTA